MNLLAKKEAFEGLCFVDSLDLARDRQMTFLTEANTERVERQKNADINVIIGNPPYNVGQLNENDNNKNRKYAVIDKRIRETYAKESNATLKNQLYDAYVRFFRWAIDRLEDRPGIVCYVSNNSFVDQFAFDGMRKHLLQDFDCVYHLDLHGNVRQNPKISGTTHNVFGIQVGVGITVAIRSDRFENTRLYFHRLPEFWRKENKLDYLTENVAEDGKHNALNTVEWKRLIPNNKHTWLRSDTEEEFDAYLPIGSKAAKRGKPDQTETIFKTYSGGVKTNRDMHVFDFSSDRLQQRIKQFVDDYNSEIDRYRRQSPKPEIDTFVDYDKLKWSATLKDNLKRNNYANYVVSKIRLGPYRPFSNRYLFLDHVLNDRVLLQHRFLPTQSSELENIQICVSGVGSSKQFQCYATNCIPCYDVLDKGQCFPFYTYDEDGSNRRENITDYALDQFRSHYNDPAISKWDIFYYVYGLLHHSGLPRTLRPRSQTQPAAHSFCAKLTNPIPRPLPRSFREGESIRADEVPP